MNSRSDAKEVHASPHLERRGLLLVLSSPSGAGKTTLSRGLLKDDDNINLSISMTTRPPRPGEVEGQDYYFVSQPQFEAERKAGNLLEWAKVFDNYYGTPRSPVEESIAKGRDVLFDIDWQGCQQLEEKMAVDLVRVFVLPPSAKVLEQRLRDRAQDSSDVVARRMQAASAEISHWAEYDYVLVNSDVDVSLAGLKAILAAERLKRERLRGLSSFVRDLQSDL